MILLVSHRYSDDSASILQCIVMILCGIVLILSV